MKSPDESSSSLFHRVDVRNYEREWTFLARHVVLTGLERRYVYVLHVRASPSFLLLPSLSHSIYLYPLLYETRRCSSVHFVRSKITISLFRSTLNLMRVFIRADASSRLLTSAFISKENNTNVHEKE